MLQVQALVRKHYPGSEVKAFGSLVSGLFSDSSDLDLVITTQPYQPPLPVLKTLCFSARVPIIKLTSPLEAGFTFDISCNTMLGYYNSQLIRQYCQSDSRVRGIAVAVRSWAKKLLLSFLNWVAFDVDWSKCAVSVPEASVVPKGWRKDPIVVLDPFDGTNTTRPVDDSRFDQVMHAFRKAAHDLSGPDCIEWLSSVVGVPRVAPSIGQLLQRHEQPKHKAESSTSKALKRNFKEVVLSWSMADVHNKKLYAQTVEKIPLSFDDSSRKRYHELMYWPLIEDLREVVFLDTQYRMLPDISQFPSRLFYGGRLKDSAQLATAEKRPWNVVIPWVHTYAVLDVIGSEKKYEGSYENIYEVACVSFLLDQISRAPGDPSVAVIAPYKRQKERLEIHCRDKHFRCKPAVGTVDSFQGKEYDIVILSATRANREGRIGFLKEQRRLNVALTRARSSMIVVCSVSTLKNSAERVWVDMIKDAEARNRVFGGPTDMDMRLKVELLLGEMQLAPFGSNIWSTRIDEQGRQSLIHLCPQERLSVFNCINRITQGRWFESEIRSQGAAKDSALKCGIHVVWTVEVDARKRTQVVKVISAVKGTDVAAFIKTANLALGRRTQEHASLCETDKPANKIVAPLFWSESEWKTHKELIALPVMTKGAAQPVRSKDEEEIGKILLQKSYEYNGNFVRALMQAGPRRGQEIPFLLSEEETEIASRSDSTFVLGRSGTGKTTILLMRIIATASLSVCFLDRHKDPGILSDAIVEDRSSASAYGTAIDLEAFESQYWPRFDSNLKNGLRPTQVWTEIVSVIKGGVQSLRNATGFLSQEQYLEQVARRRTSSTVPAELALAVYSLFERYQKMKILQKEHDCLDIVAYLFRSLEAMDPQPQWLPAFDNVYLDEAQDLCPAQLVLLSFLCRNPKGYVCVGDTAQTIAKGSSFRFEDLKEIFYVSVLGRDASAVPKVDQLTKNYRSHSGIVSLANSITQICSRFYPQMIDSLKQEESATMGPKPIAVRESKQAHSLVETLCGYASQKEGRAREIGAQLAIIVRNDAKKSAIQEQMPSANILTVFESKGLEFEHVLVVDFFADSDADPSLWRAAYSWMKALGAAFRPMLSYWTAIGCVSVVDELTDEQIAPLLSGSSAEEWTSTGKEFYVRERFDEAARCFANCGNEEMRALSVGRKHEGRAAPADTKRWLAESFEEASMFNDALKAWKELSDFRSAARCCAATGKVAEATQLWASVGMLLEAVECTRKKSAFDVMAALIAAHRDAIVFQAGQLPDQKRQILEGWIKACLCYFDKIHDTKRLQAWLCDLHQCTKQAEFHAMWLWRLCKNVLTDIDKSAPWFVSSAGDSPPGGVEGFGGDYDEEEDLQVEPEGLEVAYDLDSPTVVLSLRCYLASKIWLKQSRSTLARLKALAPLDLLRHRAADFFRTAAESAEYSSLYCESCCGVVLELREEKERLITLPSYASSGGEREQTLEAACSVDDLLSDLELDNSKHKTLDVAWLASQLDKAGRVLAESRTHMQ
eukprot:m51a1_g11571 hypothetical protein (1516) ;mRNA; r:122-8927